MDSNFGIIESKFCSINSCLTLSDSSGMKNTFFPRFLLCNIDANVNLFNLLRIDISVCVKGLAEFDQQD